MGKYIKLFDTHSQYESSTADTQNFILPNVSYCKDQANVVHYNPTQPVPPTPTHDYVEIGGIKWATMNVGANSVTDYGLYFQWGDTQGYTADQVGSDSGQKYFGWEDYKYGNDTTGMSKYNFSDDKTVLDASDDAVTAAWGGNWRIPTSAEFVTLSTATTSAWTSSYEGSGIAGLVLTSKADSSIKLFFPAAGSCADGSVIDVDIYGYYWSNSLSNTSVLYAYSLDPEDGYVAWQNIASRCDGYSVRGVLDE